MTDFMPETFIDNEVTLQSGQPYGAILGLSPSQGARSPILWKAAYDAMGLDMEFHPFDVRPDNLPNLIKALRQDRRFVGGACAVPYKEQLLPLLDEIEPEAQDIRAVNAIYRNADGLLVGANTDGEGGLLALTELLADLKDRKVLLLGLGGAGKAVATYLAYAGAVLSVWNRSAHKATEFASALAKMGKAVSAVAEIDVHAMKDTDVLVNCTSVGFSPDSSENEDAPLDLSLLNELPKSAIVYDIIYQPLKTNLLQAAEALGLRTLNGKPMNMNQAVLAFCKAVPDADKGVVEAAMAKA